MFFFRVRILSRGVVRFEALSFGTLVSGKGEERGREARKREGHHVREKREAAEHESTKNGEITHGGRTSHRRTADVRNGNNL